MDPATRRPMQTISLSTKLSAISSKITEINSYKTPKKLIFFDIETTGLYCQSGDRIVEIACCQYENQKLVSTFRTLINPEREIPLDATRVHKITNNMVRNAPKFSEIASAFLEFVKDAVLIGHNSRRFDIPFLNSELKRANLATLKNEQEDTIEIHRRLYPGKPARLDQMCQHFGIDLTERDLDGHGALLDAQLTASCYFHMMP